MTNQNISYRILEASVTGLKFWEEKKYSIDDYIDTELKDDDTIRKSVTSLLFTYFRNKAIIDTIIKNLTETIDKDIERILQITLTQAYYQNGIAPESAANVAVELTKDYFHKRHSGFVNAVLRNALKIDPEDYINSISKKKQKKIFPKLYRRWKHTLGADSDSVVDLLKNEVSFTFRALKQLPTSELKATNCKKMILPSWADNYIFYTTTTPSEVFKTNWIENGSIYIQDPATVLAPSLLNIESTDVVIDMCAAPGGKSIALSEKLNGAYLISSDSSIRRQHLTLENFTRLGLNHPIIAASALTPPFRDNSINKILLDVPCSNTGVIRKRPDAIWRFSTEHQSELVAIQRRILESAIRILAHDGTLVYSTCSIEPEENTLQIKSILEDYPELELIEEKLIIPTTEHDGCYAAKLHKRK